MVRPRKTATLSKTMQIVAAQAAAVLVLAGLQMPTILQCAKTAARARALVKGFVRTLMSFQSHATVIQRALACLSISVWHHALVMVPGHVTTWDRAETLPSLWRRAHALVNRHVNLSANILGQSLFPQMHASDTRHVWTLRDPPSMLLSRSTLDPVSDPMLAPILLSILRVAP